MGNVKRVLIDRNTLVGKDGLFSKRGCPGNCQHCGLWTENGCRVIIEAQPVDAVEVVHGRWIHDQVEYVPPLSDLLPVWVDVLQCSICESYFDMPSETNYCPNCGEKMDL